MRAHPEHVVFVAHNGSVQGIDHRALIALDIEHGPHRIFSVNACIISAVMGKSQEGPAKTIEMGNGGSIDMSCRFIAAACSADPFPPLICC